MPGRRRHQELGAGVRIALTSPGGRPGIGSYSYDPAMSTERWAIDEGARRASARARPARPCRGERASANRGASTEGPAPSSKRMLPDKLRRGSGGVKQDSWAPRAGSPGQTTGARARRRRRRCLPRSERGRTTHVCSGSPVCCTPPVTTPMRTGGSHTTTRTSASRHGGHFARLGPRMSSGARVSGLPPRDRSAALGRAMADGYARRMPSSCPSSPASSRKVEGWYAPRFIVAG